MVSDNELKPKVIAIGRIARRAHPDGGAAPRGARRHLPMRAISSDTPRAVFDRQTIVEAHANVSRLGKRLLEELADRIDAEHEPADHRNGGECR